ncbi:hypothetical protein ANTQUA_LOCUS6026 [Anthophora quadrimaculata]
MKQHRSKESRSTRNVATENPVVVVDFLLLSPLHPTQYHNAHAYCHKKEERKKGRKEGKYRKIERKKEEISMLIPTCCY